MTPQSSRRRYFEPLAVLEATVAIMSGVLIWMGFWDLVEEIIPDTWYNKLLMILVGLMGALPPGRGRGHGRRPDTVPARRARHGEHTHLV